MATPKRVVLEDLITEKQIYDIVNQCVGDVQWELIGNDISAVGTEELVGYMGEYFKAVLYVRVENEIEEVYLFLKSLPLNNKAKADFVNNLNFFRREKLMYGIIEQMCDNDPNPWCMKAYIYTDSIIVLPDLSVMGYVTRHFLKPLDEEHLFLTTSSIARLHAAFVNYETKRRIDLKRPYTILEEYDKIMKESLFCDSPFVRAASKLPANFLKTFSKQTYRNMPNLEAKCWKKLLLACDSLKYYKETVNVLVHRDLWINNIMFNYENDVPKNAILLDYQCMRYAPPAFDLMILLYITTERKFRESKEKDIYNFYYSVFIKHLNNDSKIRMADLGYDKIEFFKWCEKARFLGMFTAIVILPNVVLNPKVAQEIYGNPETYHKHMFEDRSEPLIEHARRCKPYRLRNLEACEEFVERYLLK